MIWVDRIKDLQFYHQSPGQYCYCDLVLLPWNLTLQAQISKVTAVSTCEIHAYSPDGLTDLGDFTSKFSWYTCQYKGMYFWTAVLSDLSGLCAVNCFILRVVIKEGNTVVWDKFTERYCIPDCCQISTEMTYTQEGFQSVQLSVVDQVYFSADGCDQPVISLSATSRCYNYATGYFYGVPESTISGNSAPFGYYHITILKGIFYKKPVELVRTISRNCFVQEIERTQKWQLQTFEQFPLWKVEDLQNHFSDEFIAIRTDYLNLGNQNYTLDTTTPFELIGRRHADQKYDRYKMDLEFRDCRKFHMFGCGEICTTAESNTMAFVVPANAEVFYDEGGAFIAGDAEGVLTYLRSIDQTTDAAEVFLSPVNSTWNIFTVSGNGYLPGSLYANSYTYENKIPAIPVTINTDYGALIPVVPCSPVTIGVITSETQTCESVSIGTITSETMGETSATIIEYQDWLIDAADTSMTKLEYIVSFDLKVFNSDFPIGGVDVPVLSGEIIAVIPYPCRPRVAQSFGHNVYSSIPADANIVVTPEGYIYYNGSVTSADETGSTIELTNILYNL